MKHVKESLAITPQQMFVVEKLFLLSNQKLCFFSKSQFENIALPLTKRNKYIVTRRITLDPAIVFVRMITGTILLFPLFISISPP